MTISRSCSRTSLATACLAALSMSFVACARSGAASSARTVADHGSEQQATTTNDEARAEWGPAQPLPTDPLPREDRAVEATPLAIGGGPPPTTSASPPPRDAFQASSPSTGIRPVPAAPSAPIPAVRP